MMRPPLYLIFEGKLFRSFCITRQCSKTNADNNWTPQPQSQKLHNTTWVGPPHPISNLRPVLHPNCEKLTSAEKLFYKVHAETQLWNQEYWEHHNKEFKQLKAEFVEEYRRKNCTAVDKDHAVPAEEMSFFYRKFLDENHSKHTTYNWEWYQKNFYLVWLALKANISRAFSSMHQRK